jgi:hypothetical protein
LTSRKQRRSGSHCSDAAFQKFPPRYTFDPFHEESLLMQRKISELDGDSDPLEKWLPISRSISRM